MLEKNMTHNERIIMTMVQGVHSDSTSAKIVQKETKKCNINTVEI